MVVHHAANKRHTPSAQEEERAVDAPAFPSILAIHAGEPVQLPPSVGQTIPAVCRRR